MIPFLPKIDYDLLIRCCDVGLIFLDHRFSIPNYPSRILSYMDAALPILAATDTNTDIKQLIIKEKLGYWCESNDVNSFNNSLQLLCEPDVLLRMGQTPKKTLLTKFTSNSTYETMSKHFFVYCLAYGSNMSKNQMKDRCKSAEFISAGYLDGYQLVFDGYSKNRNGMVADIKKVLIQKFHMCYGKCQKLI